MSWVKLDDRFPRNLKIVGLSDKAFRAHVTAMCLAAETASDGFIHRNTQDRKAATELETAGLWETCENGWQIHDFLEYNLSHEQWQVLKQKRSKAGRIGAAKRHGKAPGNLLADPEPDPEYPEPETSTAPRVDPNPFQPTNDQLYLAQKLSMAYHLKRPLDIPQIVKLNREFGREVVLSSLRSIGNIPGDIHAKSIYPFVRGVCVTKSQEAG